jgi:hypothetical protein
VEVDLYGRLVVLTGCDPFTRSHLASEGIELAAQEPPPADPYEASQLRSGCGATMISPRMFSPRMIYPGKL